MNTWLKALSRTRQQFSNALSRLVGITESVGGDALEDLESRLLQSDLPVSLSHELITLLQDQGVARGQRAIDLIRARLLSELGSSEHYRFSRHPSAHVILMLGINGSGKTTSTAKLGAKIKREGLVPVLGAADTFRAAGSSQLKLWGDRLGLDVVTGAMGADAASVAFDTVDAALARSADVVVIDTAGRMHTKLPLMDELEKVVRAISKRLPNAPHERWIVLDASMGQNAIQQARMFNQRVPLTGVIITKLDGSSKAGFIFSIRKELGIPVRFIGLGEGEDDLAVFDPVQFVDALLGMTE